MPRPSVTLHFAQSLDGRIGLGRDCERAVLSSEEGVVCAHRARDQHDAVLVGIETVLHDDPMLSTRAFAGRQPLRVVLDSSLRLPLSARLLQPDTQAGSVVVFCTSARASEARRLKLEQAGVAVHPVEGGVEGRVSLAAALRALAARGVERLLVEGGATVITAFLAARLADRAEIEVSPLFLGAPSTPAVRELGISSLAEALRLESLEVERLGESLLVRGNVRYPSGLE